ncbi:MAG: copper oxidase [Nitrospira sp.]
MNLWNMKSGERTEPSYSRVTMGGVALGIAALVGVTSCVHLHPSSTPRTIHAEVVALDQQLVYNRFGSMNPYGMIFALKRDVVNRSDRKPMDDRSKPGEVQLRDGKRPRPLVLRVAPGDRLVVHFTNMLSPEQPDLSSKTWAPPYTNLNLQELPPLPGEVEEEEPGPSVTGEAASEGCGSDQASGHPPNPADRRNDWPRTRCASITVSGLTSTGNTFDPTTTGIAGIAPGRSITYTWEIPWSKTPSTHLFFSNAAPAGGEGDGGSLVHGLFGALHVEPKGSQWYRSQTTREEYAEVRAQRQGSALLNYEALDAKGIPILNVLRERGPQEFDLVHGDLNAIVVDHKSTESPAFREFTAVFHDELKTFYRDEFIELEQSFTLAGVRDGFGINYGASGMGSILLANRKGIGPAKDCVECAYEEFFLESWANGDPALLHEFADDPSNVHHSYLNDRVEFRNLHAGPKETHVFHLHAHQWLAQQAGTGTYLDSQTIAPQQGFVYPIFYGGSGNRNKTPGDSIFHCHLYPHFAQGMWELWRVHDVFEDGSRRLPDGELGRGTDPKTGVTDVNSGTPIPAVIPLPGQAMPPAPGYGPDENPGFPFFIPGIVGHRAPQPPMDMVEDGGLPRHVITGGTRSVSHLTHAKIQSLPESQRGKDVVHRALSTGDMTVKLESAKIEILPKDGTASEQAAMAFHAKPTGHHSVQPDGTPAIYGVNGRPPQQGAPFADPCDVNVAKLAGQVDDKGELLYRDYEVSAIDVDMVVNHDKWHDPQGRINVLDRDVSQYVGESGKVRVKTEQAKPFFFRANSGECIRYQHTNRSNHELHLDDFQVATPTDTIGQHIHLVKFDVMSSDGSGNGWNYEDGTFAQGAIRERIEASHKPGGQTIDAQGHPIRLNLPGPYRYQTTMQRWFADPLMEDFKTCEASGGVRGRPSQAPQACRDRTIRTVFTHDHFGPSSIQQHGFYSALLIEPSRSEWLKPNGDPLTEGVGTQAIIKARPEDQDLHPDHREFALAIADFALLYDPHRQHGENLGEGKSHGMQHLVEKAEAAKIDKQTVKKLKQHAEGYWKEHGQPVDPPSLPEAISKDHHNPYLVNYRHEPLPLRIGLRDTDGSITRQKTSGDCRPEQAGVCGDLAFAFDSQIHGDPASEIFEGYEGELTQLRVIQGAQEVQHMLNIHGMRWPREIANSKSPLVSAQEIGISEHFELKLPLANVFRGVPVADYLYEFGSVDDLWNGAWGLIRAYNGVDAADPQGKDKNKTIDSKHYAGLSKAQQKKQPWYQPIGDRLRPLQEGGSGKIDLALEQGYLDGTCPQPASVSEGRTSEVTFYIDAVSVKDWLGVDLPYDRDGKLFDPNALTYVLLHRLPVGATPLIDTDLEGRRTILKEEYTHRLSDPTVKTPIEPLVLRANAGDCIKIVLANRLPQRLGDDRGDALMPKIVSLNVDQDPEEGGPGAEDVRPSSFVTLHPQLVSYNMPNYNGAAVGYNGERPVPPGASTTLYWYAGTATVEGNRLKHEPKEFGPVNLTSWGDIINQPSHGLVGALIIEPKGATYHDPATGDQVPNGGISAVIRYPIWYGTRSFREHVVIYRDGLNLHYTKSDGTSDPLPDCRICDDSYDLGDKAFNYHTAPFQIRLGQAPEANLNEAFYPTQFFTPQYKPIPTTTYTAVPGEEVRFRVLQPHGRARQHAFLLYGHDFEDLLPYYGSPHSPLMSVGKAMTVKIPRAHEGYWLYRDGPAQMWSGGLWGSFQVGEPKSPAK